MPVFHSDELVFRDLHIAAIIFGAPGTGKSTLGYSAKNPLLINLDKGAHRVKPEHRDGKDTSVCSNFDEVKADVEYAKGKYDTIVIDTGGALVEMLKQYVVDHPGEFKGGAKAMGGISLQGYGFVKQLWNDFTNNIRNNFDVLFIFHETAEKNNDEGVFYNIVVEGAARNGVWQSSDLAGRLFINNGQRYLGFTPTESYSAKSSFGISGLVAVPELKSGDPNNFIEKLFATARKNLAAENNALAPQKAQYAEAMAAAKEACAAVTKPEDVAPAAQYIKGLKHALTSEKEATAMLKARLAELGIVWNKTTKNYEYKA